MFNILVVEDNANTRKLMTAVLSQNNYFPLEACDGIEALEVLDRKHVDLIILDIMMPGKDGWTVCKFIRSKYDVPVIFLTALGDESDMIEGYEIGADEYVTKPFSTKVLLLKINALISRYKGLMVKNGIIVSGEIEIEPARRRVTIEGKEIKLAPKEYELLICFIENKGIVLTRNQLLDKAWGEDFDGYDRSVDTHIKKLRAALGNANYHIETVIKSGYIWKDAKS